MWYFMIFDCIVTALAIVGNCLVLDCILRKPFGLPGYRRFLVNLICSELFLCSINGLTFIYQVATNDEQGVSSLTCGGHFLRNLQMAGFISNLLSLVSLSFDHYTGVMYPLQYQQILNSRFVLASIATIWLISATIGMVDVPVILALYVNSEYYPNEGSQAATKLKDLSNSLFAFEPSLPQVSEMESDCGGKQLVRRDTTQNQTVSLSLPRFTNSVDDDSDFFSFIGGAPDVSQDLFSMVEETITSEKGCQTGNRKNGSNTSVADFMKAFMSLVNEESHEMHFCAYYGERKMWMELIVIALTAVSLAFLTVCYGKIFKEAFSKLDLGASSFRKLCLTTFTFSGAFALCFLPFMSFEMAQFAIGYVATRFSSDNNEAASYLSSPRDYVIAQNALYSLLLLYPLFAPLIYAVRMKFFRRYLFRRYGRLLTCPEIPRSFRNSLTVPRVSRFPETQPTTQRQSFAMAKNASEVQKGADNSVFQCEQIPHRLSISQLLPSHDSAEEESVIRSVVVPLRRYSATIDINSSNDLDKRLSTDFLISDKSRPPRLYVQRKLSQRPSLHYYKNNPTFL